MQSIIVPQEVRPAAVVPVATRKATSEVFGIGPGLTIHQTNRFGITRSLRKSIGAFRYHVRGHSRLRMLKSSIGSCFCSANSRVSCSITHLQFEFDLRYLLSKCRCASTTTRSRHLAWSFAELRHDVGHPSVGRYLAIRNAVVLVFNSIVGQVVENYRLRQV